MEQNYFSTLESVHYFSFYFGPRIRQWFKNSSFWVTKGIHHELQKTFHPSLPSFANRCNNRILREYYLRLRANGKRLLVAMTAIMRKLVILLKHLLNIPILPLSPHIVASLNGNEFKRVC